VSKNCNSTVPTWHIITFLLSTEFVMETRMLIFFACLTVASATLEVVNQWNLLQFDFPPDPVLLEKFQPENTVPTGLEIGWDKLYIGIPRLRAGVPATLAWVPRSLPPGVSPVLQVCLMNNYIKA
jgi:hypothetical protein